MVSCSLHCSPGQTILHVLENDTLTLTGGGVAASLLTFIYIPPREQAVKISTQWMATPA